MELFTENFARSLRIETLEKLADEQNYQNELLEAVIGNNESIMRIIKSGTHFTQASKTELIQMSKEYPELLESIVSF